MRPTSSHNTQTIENLLKAEITKHAELFNEMLKSKEQNKNAHILWEILGIHQLYNTSTKRCMLCLNEKLAIALHKEGNVLNTRIEIISKCKHSIKYNLVNYDTKD